MLLCSCMISRPVAPCWGLFQPIVWHTTRSWIASRVTGNLLWEFLRRGLDADVSYPVIPCLGSLSTCQNSWDHKSQSAMPPNYCIQIWWLDIYAPYCRIRWNPFFEPDLGLILQFYSQHHRQCHLWKSSQTQLATVLGPQSGDGRMLWFKQLSCQRVDITLDSTAIHIYPNDLIR